MKLKICPLCDEVFIDYGQRDYYAAGKFPVIYDSGCGTLLNDAIMNNAQCSSLNTVKSKAGTLAKKYKLSESKKKLFFNEIKKVKQKHPQYLDYKVIEIAINKVAEGCYDYGTSIKE
ncbi:hypothetical protein M2325_000691 [Methanococcus voltae PS]|uniref:Uncharacterized protein n=1 Tax=Methanococcus voltae PS TaxID=523842 RepID=A0ABT2EVM3_METVO|nr:hypothetical protein [Methanococcus voltae]MCS3922006.1 hypothetical protein [Methanococcus voltae PS]